MLKEDVFDQARNINKTFGIELLLVAQGAKPGDNLNTYKMNTPEKRRVAQILEEAKRSYPCFEFDCESIGEEIFFYNKKRVSPGFLSGVMKARRKQKIGYSIERSRKNLAYLRSLEETRPKDFSPEYEITISRIGLTRSWPLEYHVIMGMFFGYPLCDIKEFICGKPVGRILGTEHQWCSYDCKRSGKIEQSFEETMDRVKPEWANWKEEWLLI